MGTREPILEHWIAETIRAYPEPAATFLSGEGDPFRNPVGHTIRQSLAVLLDELRGEMDTAAIASALDALVRLRAVQDLSPSQAVGFVYLLKPILRKHAPEADQAGLGDRIDRLALMAFDQYMNCREQVAEIRWRESRRQPVRQASS